MPGQVEASTQTEIKCEKSSSICYTIITKLSYPNVWNILDVFNTFQVITDVLTLDQSLVKTTVPEEMKFGVTLNDQGYWKNRSANFLLQHLVKLISNPGLPEEAVKINTALKTLCIKQNGSSSKFYEMVSEATH